MSNQKGEALVPIINFDCAQDLVKLDNTLCIRRITPSETELIKQNMLDYFYVFKREVTVSKFFIAKEFADATSLSSTVEFTHWEQDSENIQKIALALRLIGITDFGLPTSIFISPTSFYMTTPSPLEPVSSDFEAQVYLSEDMIGDFVNLWKRIDSVEKNKPYLEFALKQFNSSFTENSVEAMLLDCVTAFESIVFHNERRAPNPYGIAIGIAIGMLIGKDAKERNEVKELLNVAYEKRNTIVHGNLRRDQMDLDDLKFCGKVVDYLRRSLRKLLEE